MYRRVLAVVAWLGIGCVDHYCDQHRVDDPPYVHGSVDVTVPNGAAAIPAVAVKVSGTRVTDAYYVDGTSGEDSGSCGYATEPLTGTATITAEGGQPSPLMYSGGEFSGRVPYATAYRLALRESVDEDHVTMVTMPKPFTISHDLVAGIDPSRDFSVTPAASIPERSVFGVDIPVSGLAGAGSLAVTVDIAHPSRGDLSLELWKDHRPVKTLVENVGGTIDNIKETFTLTGAELGSEINGVWMLYVWDQNLGDTGTLNKVTLSFAPADDLLVESSTPLAGGEYASVEVFECKTRSALSNPSYPSGPAAWRISTYRLDPASNYRITVTRRSSFEPFGSTSFGVYGDFVVPNGAPCN